MLYSFSPEEEKKRLFLIFLSDAKHGRENYSTEVKKVLREVIDLCNNKKTIYNIDRNYFDIIIGLAEHQSKFYKNLDINKIDLNMYDTIINHVEQLDTLEYA